MHIHNAFVDSHLLLTTIEKDHRSVQAPVVLFKGEYCICIKITTLQKILSSCV